MFKLLNRISNNKPVYTHLWSCYAANADKEFSYLPQGSLAILHSSKNTTSEESIGCNFDYNEHDDSIVGAKKNLLVNLEHIITIGGTVKFSKSKKEYAVKYVLPEIVKAKAGYFDFIYEYFHKIGTNHLVLATKDIEKDISSFVTKIKEMLCIEEKSSSVETKSTKTPSKKIKGIRDYFQLSTALERNSHSLLKKLLEKSKIDPNSQNDLGSTVISEAKDKKSVELLVKHGADVNHQSKNNYTPLIITLLRDKPYEVIEALLKGGANPNLSNRFGNTAIFYAKDKQTIELLVKHKADINHQDKNGDTPLSLGLILNKPHEVITGLLTAGANPNLPDQHGKTAICYAKDKQTIELLVKHKADINYQDKNGYTPLISALSAGQPQEVITTLLEAGANPFLKESKSTCYETALRIAPKVAKTIEENIGSKTNPFQYLIECHKDKNLFKTIAQLKSNNLEVYNKLDTSEIKKYLDKTIIVGGHKISNFRKAIKNGTLENLESALTFDPIVRIEDIKMAERIFGKDFPEKMLNKMHELVEKSTVTEKTGRWVAHVETKTSDQYKGRD
jgi:ankyrin repeat protein